MDDLTRVLKNAGIEAPLLESKKPKKKKKASIIGKTDDMDESLNEYSIESVWGEFKTIVRDYKKILRLRSYSI